MATSEKWIPFFMKGKFTDSKGREHVITDQKLDQIVAVNKGRDVALAIGHPKGNAPAMGWVNDYKKEGAFAFAKVKSLAPEFEAGVNKGHWKKISPSVNGDGLLNHIGFFGTQPVAMDGIPMIEFSAPDDETVIEFSAAEFSDWRMSTIGRLFQRIREYIISKDGTEAADKVISNYEIEDIEREPAMPDAPLAFSKPHKEAGMKTAAELETELAAERQKTQKLTDDLAAERRKKQRSEFSAFLEGKVKIGTEEIDMTTRITPAMKPAILDLMEFMSGTESYEFSAAEVGKTEKKSPVEVFKAIILPNLREQLSASEFARHDSAGRRMTEEDQVVKDIASASPKTAA